MILKMKVKPNSQNNSLEKVAHPDYDFKVFIHAAPEKGKANIALRAFLAEKFGVTTSMVSILSGHNSNIKRVEISEDK